ARLAAADVLGQLADVLQAQLINGLAGWAVAVVAAGREPQRGATRGRIAARVHSGQVAGGWGGHFDRAALAGLQIPNVGHDGGDGLAVELAGETGHGREAEAVVDDSPQVGVRTGL